MEDGGGRRTKGPHAPSALNIHSPALLSPTEPLPHPKLPIRALVRFPADPVTTSKFPPDPVVFYFDGPSVDIVIARADTQESAIHSRYPLLHLLEDSVVLISTFLPSTTPVSPPFPSRHLVICHTPQLPSLSTTTHIVFQAHGAPLGSHK